MTNLNEHGLPESPTHEKLKTTGSLGLVELNKVVESQGLQINKLFEKLESLSTGPFVGLKAELEHQLPYHKPEPFMAFFQALNMGKEIHQDRALQLKFAVDAFRLACKDNAYAIQDIETLVGGVLVAENPIVKNLFDSEIKYEDTTCKVINLMRGIFTFYKNDGVGEPSEIWILDEHRLGVNASGYIFVGFGGDLITDEDFEQLRLMRCAIDIKQDVHDLGAIYQQVAFPWF